MLLFYLFDEFLVGGWQVIDELVVEVHDIIDHVVTDDWLLGFDEHLNDQRETHLCHEEFSKSLQEHFGFALLINHR